VENESVVLFLCPLPDRRGLARWRTEGPFPAQQPCNDMHVHCRSAATPWTDKWFCCNLDRGRKAERRSPSPSRLISQCDPHVRFKDEGRAQLLGFISLHKVRESAPSERQGRFCPLGKRPIGNTILEPSGSSPYSEHGLEAHPLCDIQSICGFFMGPWTVTRLFFTADAVSIFS
jgi:hypothetical protein